MYAMGNIHFTAYTIIECVTSHSNPHGGSFSYHCVNYHPQLWVKIGYTSLSAALYSHCLPAP